MRRLRTTTNAHRLVQCLGPFVVFSDDNCFYVIAPSAAYLRRLGVLR